MFEPLLFLVLTVLPLQSTDSQVIKLEETLATANVQVDERREFIDRTIHSAGGQALETAQVQVQQRFEWRELRLILLLGPSENSISSTPFGSLRKISFDKPLSNCLKSEAVQRAVAPLAIGIEMGIAPMPEKIQEFQNELTSCFSRSLPRSATVSKIDFKINTVDQGWSAIPSMSKDGPPN